MYEDGKAFCDLSDINNKIKDQPSIALAKRIITITNDQPENAFDYFLGVIDTYIIERHKTKGNPCHGNRQFPFPRPPLEITLLHFL
ncbi:ABC-three component system protein [Pseudomonas fulva]|uniref:ABC-three component system protein n=1 Tax=Pseudomonas fulva TaxID=47880 RepID=UPI003132E9CB